MLSDAFTSPWSAEVLITGDIKLPLFDDSDDDLDLTYCKNRLTDIDSRSYLENISTSSCSSDEFYMDGEDECFLLEAELASVAVSLESELFSGSNGISDSSSRESTVLSERVSTVTPDVNDNTWTPISVPVGSQAYTCTTIPRKSHQSSTRQHCKKWSQMSRSEKLKKVEDLSSVMTCELDLRQQMEVIKIIDPAADVYCGDIEFAIDLEALNDRKLEGIENIVNFHCSQTLESDCFKNDHNSDRKFLKKNRSQDRRPCSKVTRRRLQKEHKQRLKERRSGLFVKEERLAVSSEAIEEEIDVLG